MESKYFNSFVQRIDSENLDVFGIMYFKNGELMDEYRWKPDVPVNIWSHTKCFTNAAVGIAISEGKMTLEDKVCDYFPEFMPENPDPRLFKITLRHLLTMSSGFGQMILAGEIRDIPEKQLELLPRDNHDNPVDLVQYILSHKMNYEPGERFSYNNGDADLIARMVEKAVGMTMHNYLYYKLFKPLGIDYPEWEHDLRGHTYGDSALHLSTLDMSKLSRLYMNGGSFNGLQLISKEWIEQSTKKQIETADPSRHSAHFDPWSCGYGYLIWMYPYKNAYRFSGMFGQNSLVFPDQKTIFCFNSNVRELGKLKAAVDDELITKYIK